jgi:hypothetical protein
LEWSFKHGLHLMDLVSIQAVFKLSFDLETSQNLSLVIRGQKIGIPRRIFAELLGIPILILRMPWQ